jgi:scyllo-inositol 2-dehydrogenase (NADP+)
VGLKVGIAGYGLAGAVFHAPLIEFVDGLDLVKVMTRSPERAAQATVPVVASVDELVDGIDVLVVATANVAHVEVARAGLDAGCFVVVDKPMAVTAADARALADAGGERVTVFHNRRWDGDFLTVKRLLREDALGQITRFESRFERFRPQIKEGWREGGDPSQGGGVLLDLGPHLVDQALTLFGPPTRVHGELRIRRAGAHVDDDAFIALEHAGGAISHLWMSAIAPLYGPRFRVSGLESGFASDGLDPQEDQLRGGMSPGAAGFGEKEGLERGWYPGFYEGVRDWARGESPPPVDPADGVRVLEILEQARSQDEANAP